MSKPATTMINGFDASRLGSLPERERSMIERRQGMLGPSYRLFYENPLHLVRGEGVWLYDPNGNAYLDTYNNVPSVGHCHPRVVGAIAEQAAVLNTHTRYLDEKILDYSNPPFRKWFEVPSRSNAVSWGSVVIRTTGCGFPVGRPQSTSCCCATVTAGGCTR